MGTDRRPAGARRRKCSYSGDATGRCVEVADLAAHVAVRGPENPEDPAFLASPAAFTMCVSAAAEGRNGR
ncbi:DUF397 domain-containing protein [Streptomyces roseolus]|uniref:DUF397 domain-containing protein n=1 Tax=Streptomyces roseolus TaxID=67358 RepID=UPI0036F12D47